LGRTANLGLEEQARQHACRVNGWEEEAWNPSAAQAFADWRRRRDLVWCVAVEPGLLARFPTFGRLRR
jgi:hypothetical protein